MAGLQSRLRESQASLSDVNGQLMPKEFELTKTTREKELLSTRVNELEAAQTARTNELIELRRQHTTKILALESACNTAQAEATERQDRIKALQVREGSIVRNNCRRQGLHGGY